jgi:hypothetical protein
MFGVIAMKTLVERLQPQKVGGRARCGDGALALPSQGWCIVGSGGECAFSHIERVCQHIFVDNGGQEFEVTIGDGAFWVVKGHKVSSDVGGEVVPPNYGGRSVRMERGFG